MSRLDSYIARLQAQKVLLEMAAAELRAAGERVPGPVFELGLGNGRTFDHLRQLLPDRRIIAFDRALAANPASVPCPDDLVLGPIEETGRQFAERFGSIGALLHADLGNGTAATELELERWLPKVVLALVRPGALVITSTRLVDARLAETHLPPGIAPGRYYTYRCV